MTACTWAQIERLVDEAVTRHDPVAAEARRTKAAARRRMGVERPDADGLVEVHGVLDAADGHDLEEAVRRRAALRGRLGDAQPLDVRRSIAVGEIARQDLTLDLEGCADAPDGGARAARAPGRKVVLNLHLTADADNPVARWEEGACPLSPAQVREWLGVPGTSVVVRPVVDLADHVPIDSYEVPDRLRSRVELRDHACRFPRCTTRATRCDLDHGVPHRDGGPTCPCNLVPLRLSRESVGDVVGWVDRVVPGRPVRRGPPVAA
ncbi:HNH endonuclease signature motif containing protein [Nocardioides humi]|uniref:HNH endonuclease signature motif containing protein n=1 Tax=Nocardioides humi TaxID=449461 RepID=UPI0011294E0D|nr:HNH endonuclease signature motif containing protein [Nocardioides humi]